MHRSSMRRIAVLAAAMAVAAVCAAPASASHHHAPSPGAVGIGDPLFPTLANGGYDALHYNLSLRYATATPLQTVSGKLTMIARSTQALSRFNLDFAGDSVTSVSVNGRPASFTSSDAAAAGRSRAFPSARALELGLYKR